MPTLAERLSDATALLESVSETPRLDSELLLAHALGTSRAQVLARLKDETPAERFDDLVRRRRAWEPLAYIFGEWEFFGISFVCGRPVLVPRPETEHLVETVLEFVGGGEARVLDLCTGTGCVALSVAKNGPGVTVIGTDISDEALSLAEENCSRLGLEERVRFVKGDLFEALSGEEGVFDVVCSNPPYVETGAWDGLSRVIQDYEDRAALLAGADGLAILRRIVANAESFLSPEGFLALEMGEGQDVKVRAMLQEHGYDGVASKKDLAGIDRIVFGRKGES